MSLFERLKDLNSKAISMHMPGHKNNTIGSLNELNTSFDITEITGFDDLHDPEGVLLELNNYIANKYVGYNAQMLTNGSTTGILSAIMHFSNITNRFVLVGSMHKSVFHALELMQSDYISVDIDECDEVCEGNVLIVTYPQYDGSVIDIQSLIQRAHDKNAFVIVDEAHGSHFDISPRFPNSSMNYHADIVVQSYHKTLPSLTGSSIIFVLKELNIMSSILRYIDMIETSSPSYLKLASIELAHQFYLQFEDTEFLKKRQLLIHTLLNKGFEVQESDDPLKILIQHHEVSPYDIAYSFECVDIYNEMVSDAGVLWILPLFHKGDSYPFDELMTKILSMKFIQINKTNDRNFNQLIGKCAIANIIPYPPGVPLVHKGETITSDNIETINHLHRNHVKIEGIHQHLNYYFSEADE